ncbi:hypothetical protein DAEQUDRAFT_513135 [Daedalea quercina L-15889]|uniref:Secreted protein n=1 Tax=Daedalea quercina L-15889 TaxID=1314783 RepID=A0A165MHA1_9APHY|nr:hypothetical protein DAEQUDRAFT_513135 [Daedalea quercina L-15889]
MDRLHQATPGLGTGGLGLLTWLSGVQGSAPAVARTVWVCAWRHPALTFDCSESETDCARGQRTLPPAVWLPNLSSRGGPPVWRHAAPCVRRHRSRRRKVHCSRLPTVRRPFLPCIVAPVRHRGSTDGRQTAGVDTVQVSWACADVPGWVAAMLGCEGSGRVRVGTCWRSLAAKARCLCGCRSLPGAPSATGCLLPMQQSLDDRPI